MATALKNLGAKWLSDKKLISCPDEAVSDASRREVWNEFYAENNIISARLPANLFPRRLKFFRRWKNARRAALIMKACSKARFSREKVDLESVL